MLLTSQNHSTDWIYHFHGPKKRAPPELGRKSRITKICVGVCQKFFPPTFLDVFLDVESDKKNRLKFWPSGAEKSPFFWFWPHTGQFYLVNFLKNEKIFQKSMKYSLFWSEFFTDHFPAKSFGPWGPTYAKISKKSRKMPIFKPLFLETGTFLEKTDTCVEFVLKSSLKWAKVVFFKKKMTEWP